MADTAHIGWFETNHHISVSPFGLFLYTHGGVVLT